VIQFREIDLLVSYFLPCMVESSESMLSCDTRSRAASSSAVIPVTGVDVPARAIDAVVASTDVILVRRIHNKRTTPVLSTSARIVVLILDSV
jgi:hypothetical protein